jgi:hypothetical protein
MSLNAGLASDRRPFEDMRLGRGTSAFFRPPCRRVSTSGFVVSYSKSRDALQHNSAMHAFVPIAIRVFCADWNAVD